MIVHKDLKRYLKGPVLTLPEGDFQFGPGIAPILGAQHKIVIRGAGMGKTLLRYESVPMDGDWRRGCCMFFGDPTDSSRYYNKLTVENLTIKDESTAPDFETGGNNGITIYYCNDVTIRNVELLDCHGNGCLQLVHNTNGPAVFGEATVHGKKVRLKNVHCHTSEGRSIQGDGINIGNYTDVLIEDCVCEGNIRRHGFEGGWLENTHIRGCYFAAGPDGHNGMGTLGLKDSSIVGCVVKSQRPGTPAMGFDSDAGHIPAGYNVLVAGCQISSPHEGIRIQPSNGGPQRDMSIRFNTISAPYGVSMYYRVPAGLTDIYRNVFDFGGLRGHALTGSVSGAPGAEFQDDSIVRMRENEYRNGAAGHDPEYFVVNTDDNYWPLAAGRIVVS